MTGILADRGALEYDTGSQPRALQALWALLACADALCTPGAPRHPTSYVVCNILRPCYRCSRVVNQYGSLCRRAIPAWAVACIAGAIGECGGQFCFYPFETIKVLCQSSGQGVVPTVRALFRQQPPLAAMQRLFAGVTSTMAASAVLGAAYLLVFRETTKWFCAPPAAVAPAEGWCHVCALASSACACAAPSESAQAKAIIVSTEAVKSHDSKGVRAVVLSAVATSVILALLSGPFEMARNQLQAGQIRGNLLLYTFSPRGLRSTLPMLAPYCVTAVPHDFAELFVYQFGADAVARVGNGSPIKREVLDAAVGCAAGVVGVLSSAPADCIKTKVLTMSATSAVVRAARSPEALLRAGVLAKCLATARFTWARQGLPGFFVGMTPRLVDEVPGATLHWALVAAITRFLEAPGRARCNE